MTLTPDEHAQARRLAERIVAAQDVSASVAWGDPQNRDGFAYDDEVVSVCRALLAAPPQTWQDISTAPRDGTWFWVLSPKVKNRDFERITAFKYDARKAGHECCWFAGGGWWPLIPRAYTLWAPMTGQPPAPPADHQPAEERQGGGG